LLNVFFVDIGFFLNGNLYPNNSLVDFEEIGEANKTLFCLTNNTNCCDSVSQGGWFSPGATATPILGKMESTTDFYTSRGPSAIHLNSATGSFQPGIFHCRVPDADGDERTIYIGIYPPDNEEGRMKV
jgi:hypothetical protein